VAGMALAAWATWAVCAAWAALARELATFNKKANTAMGVSTISISSQPP